MLPFTTTPSTDSMKRWAVSTQRPVKAHISQVLLEMQKLSNCAAQPGKFQEFLGVDCKLSVSNTP